MTTSEESELLLSLEARFTENMYRHPDLKWEEVEKRIVIDKDKLRSLQLMEETGGIPDVVGKDAKTGELLFFDCAPESPAGRRSFCYDLAALAKRKENKPKNSAVEAAAAMGTQLLNEEEYRYLQSLSPVDRKTSSWLATPENIRSAGGAIFGDFRYGTVFIYHNGAESYYAARGFRTCLRI